MFPLLSLFSREVRITNKRTNERTNKRVIMVAVLAATMMTGCGKETTLHAGLEERQANW